MKYLLGLLLLATALPSFAVEKSLTLTNTSTVVSQCSINTLSNIQFGSLDVLGANANVGATGNGTVRVQCTKGSYALLINNGNNWAARLTNSYPCTTCQGSGYVVRVFNCDRYMKSASGGTLGYVVYKDATRQTDGTNISAYVYAADAGTQCKTDSAAYTYLEFNDATRTNDVTLYAQTVSGAANTKITPGAYSDSLNLQINF